MIEPPDKNLSDKKFTLWVIAILVFWVFQFTLTITGHQRLDSELKTVAVAETAHQCPTASAAPLKLYP